MARANRFRKKTSDQSGFDYLEREMVKENGEWIGPDERDDPPPSRLSLGGEGDISRGDYFRSSTSIAIDVSRENPTFQITASGGITPNSTYPYMRIVGSSNILAFDSQAKLILHCDGADASTTFLDATSSKTITANGNAQVDTAQSKFGGASALFQASTADFLSIPTSTDFDFDSRRFTIDFWVRFNTVPGSNQGFFSRCEDNLHFFNFRKNTTSAVFSIGTGQASSKNPINHPWSPSVNTWYHLAIIRGWQEDINKFACTVDGVAIGTSDMTIDFGALNSPLFIGINSSTAASQAPFDGWIDEFRVSKGIARWTGNFTPPTSAYAPDAIYPVTITANPQIASGREGQTLTLFGAGSSIVLTNGNGVSLRSGQNLAMQSGSVANFIYTTGGNVWRETSRVNPDIGIGG